uniref:Putative secreted protein n=1 Tax=Ixodes ricinus TaxID=34613 RepID=A0A147BTS1_IXORI
MRRKVLSVPSLSLLVRLGSCTVCFAAACVRTTEGFWVVMVWRCTRGLGPAVLGKVLFAHSALVVSTKGVKHSQLFRALPTSLVTIYCRCRNNRGG